MMGFPNNWIPLSFGTSPENQSNAGGNFLWHIYHPHEKVAEFFYFIAEKLIFITNVEKYVELNTCCVGGLSSGGSILTT